MRWPKILVFTATYEGKDYCLDEFIKNIQNFTYPNYEHIVIDNSNDNGRYFSKLKKKLNPLGIKVYRTQRGNTSREALARAQNRAREIFLNGDYDYFLSLESDIFPASNIMEALVWDNKDIVTGLYLIGDNDKGTRLPCITLPWKNPETGTMGSRLITHEQVPEYFQKGLKIVAAGGMGCCLIDREVLERIGFTYIPGHRAHSDVFFFNKAARLGYKVWVDTNLFCGHKNSDWSKVKDR
jgi:glycosyltransferase involved in cell wall biosynthesis